jgi:glycine C-acetyltransferase
MPCHPGFIGYNQQGTPEAKGVMGRVDIITGTLGKSFR